MYWTPLSISYLVETILIFSVACHFLYRFIWQRENWQEARSTGLIAMTALGATGSTSLQLLSNSLHSFEGNLVLPWVGPAGAIAMTGFLLFAYYFLSPSGLGKWGGIVLTFLLSALVCMELFIAAERWELARFGIVEFREQWVDIPFAAGFGFSFLFFAAHLTKALARDLQVSASAGLARALMAIAWPPIKLTGQAAAARAFFYVSAMPLTIGLCILLRSYGVLDWLWAEILVCWFFLFSVAGFSLTYLKHIPERTSFRVKVIGVTLISVLSILCGVAWIIGSVYIDGFKNQHLPAEQSAIHFSPNARGGYSIAPTDYRFDTKFGRKIESGYDAVELPFIFPFLQQDYDTAYTHLSGVIGFEDLPKVRDFSNQFGPQPAIYALTAAIMESSNYQRGPGSGVFYKEDKGHVTFTWHDLASSMHPEDSYTFQVRLYESGAIDLVYKTLPKNPKPDVYRDAATPSMIGLVPAFLNRDITFVRFETDLPVETHANEGVMEYHRLDFLAYLDKIYGPIALFILVSSLAVLLVFPLFFRANLDLPLKKLILAVQQVIDGKLATEIGITHRDEIGFLASSFKKMAKAQHDLIQTLEEKVALRTVEVSEYAAKNARLEERNRLSRDLHDAVSQSLFSANLIASTLPELMEKDPRDGLRALDNIQRLNKDALVEMRQMLLELRPDALVSVPLGQLLQSLADDIETRFPVDISLVVEGDAELPEAVQLTLYRIAQESLTNAAKHAGAAKIELVFDGMQEQAMLTVCDNGKGFDVASQKLGHMGLQIMKERIMDIKGSLEIESAPGQGCQVTAIWFRETENLAHDT